VRWSQTSLRLATELTDWEPVDGNRYAAVSSFGVAGTNAHAIVAMPAGVGREQEEAHV
jgi:mycobactin polyketide synthetase MbtC